MDYARLQEATVHAIKAPNRHKSMPYQKLPQKRLLPTPTATGFKPLASPPPVVSANKPKTLTAAERADKLANGLCFFCDQVYEKGHQCNNKRTQLFLIEILGTKDEGVEQHEPEDIDGDYFLNEETPHISIHALSGAQGFQTMRVTSLFGKHPLHVLMNSGSTHNFLDISMAKKLGCRIEKTPVQ